MIVVSLSASHIAHQSFALATQIVEHRHIGEFFDNAVEIGNRFGILTRLLIKHGTVIDGNNVRRVFVDDQRKIFDGFVVVFHFHTKQTAIEVRCYVVRVQIDSIVEIGHRTEVVIELIFQECTIDKEVGIFRAQGDSATEVVDCFSVVGFVFYHYVGTHYERIGIVCVEFNAFADSVECTNSVASFEPKARQSEVSVVVFRIDLQDAVERLFRPVKVFHVGLGNCFV